ncbi:MAG: hypothetical protein IPJ69_12195 [Deltaproteobacteria bacterium]|nr:MAG: hypothetical protein IPJ69_12195 [Deltaproteobacteria bacterium]
MNAQQKIYSVILALEEASQLRSADKPLYLHYDDTFLKGISDHELVQILEKLSDEKLITILRTPAWVNEAMPYTYGLAEIEESFEVCLLPNFQGYADKLHKKFKGYFYSKITHSFEKDVPELSLPEKSPKKAEKELSTKEKSTLFKLILGMAAGGYGYDPKSIRNNAISEIAEDLVRFEIPLDEDTVRKWLKEASEVHSLTLPEEDD